ncbi:MAG: TerC family protein [Myxococcales bacterium]|nr:TerC family protein [Myxococcales bacterium]
MLELLVSPEAWVSLLVLALMEVVLGIDNIVFITILCGRLPRDRQLSARRTGLAVALVTRIGLLSAINWLMHLEQELFTLVVPWSGKDLILTLGGVFLLYKATREIYENVEHPDEHGSSLGSDAAGATGARAGAKAASFAGIIAQVMVLDIVFSLDSVITAVGMAEDIEVMVAAMVIAVAVMMVFAGPVGDFIEEHPSVRVLALAFLVLIGVMLVVQGVGEQAVPKGYIYSAMGFSLFVQVLNFRMERRREALHEAEGPA